MKEIDSRAKYFSGGVRCGEGEEEERKRWRPLKPILMINES